MADFLGGVGTELPSLGGATMSFSGMAPLPGGALGAVPTMSFSGAPDVPPGGLLQDPEEEILRRYQTLQRVRKAAGQAAQIADIDATELRRLDAHAAAVFEAAGLSKDAINKMLQQQNPKEDVNQPAPAAAAAPPPAEAPAAAPPQPDVDMKERVERVMELGNYWAAQERGEAVDAAAAVAAAAREAGSFPALAAALRAQITVQTAAGGPEVALGRDNGTVLHGGVSENTDIF